MPKIITIAVVACTLAASAFAQTSRPSTGPSSAMSDTPEQADVRKATVDFANALVADDEKALRAKFAGTDDDFAFVLATRDVMKSSQRARAAMAKTFPDESAKLRASDDMTVEGLIREINRMPVRVNGDTAQLGRAPQGGTKLVRENGTWRVTSILDEDGARGKGLQMMKVMSSVMTDAADELDAGKYATFSDFMKAMQAKQRDAMREMMQEGMNGASTRPTTGPATQPSH